jgi:hypothetical protein
MTTMFTTIFEDHDDADGTLLSSAAAGGEGGADADCGFSPFAAAVPSFDATAAILTGGAVPPARSPTAEEEGAMEIMAVVTLVEVSDQGGAPSPVLGATAALGGKGDWD